MDEKCEGCGRENFVQWCPIWNLHLCHECKSKRVEAEVRKIVQSEISEGGEG